MASVARLRTLIAMGLALLLASAVTGPALAQDGGGAATVEVRVWQNVDDERDLYVSARAAGGSWRTLGTVRLALDGLTGTGGYRHGDIALAVPRAGGGSAEVEVRVWQDVRFSTSLFVSVRYAGGSWSVPGTTALPLDGLAASGRYRYGNVRLAVPPEDAASREPTPPDASRSEIAIPSVTIEFEGEFHGAERVWIEEVERYFSSVAAFFIRRYGLAVPGLTIHMMHSEEGLLPAYGDKAFLLPTDSVSALVVAHEYVHALQDRLSENKPDWSYPAWMSEGVARYFDEKFAQSREERIVSTIYEAMLTQDSLRSMEENLYGYGPKYAVSSLAVHQLVLLAGESALFQFYSLFKGNNSWQQAFREVFGVTVDEFYEDFSSYRVSVAPSVPEFRGIVRAHDGSLVPDFMVSVFHLNTLIPGNHLGYSTVTDVYGRFNIPIRSGRYVLDVRHPNCGNAGFLDDDGYLTRSRGNARIFEVGDSNVTGIVINLPADPAQPCPRPLSGWWEWSRPPMDVEEPERVPDVRVAFLAGLPGPFGGIPRFVDGPAESALFNRPMGMALTTSGDVIVADFWNHAIRRIAPDGMVTTVAGGNGKGARDGPGVHAQFAGPADVALHADGSIYVADSQSGRIRRIGTDGMVTTVAGGGPITREWGNVDGLAAEARFSEPFAIAFDRKGNLLIVDRSSRRIRALSPSGRVSTLADTSALTHDILPTGIAIDDDGAIFFMGGFLTGDFTAVGRIDGRGSVSTVLRTIRDGSSGGIAVGPDAFYVVARPQHTSNTSDVPQLFRISRDGSSLAAIDIEGAYELAGIVRTDDGALLVSDAMNNTIWRITFGAE